MADPKQPRRGMTRRDLLLSAAGTGLALARRSGATPSARPPNIVFVLSDNHRADATGYGP